MHHFPSCWIIHLQAAFVCILCSEEDVSWAAANCLLERKCIPSLWWALNESLSLPLSLQILCLFLIFISSRFVQLAIEDFQYLPQASGIFLLFTPKSTWETIRRNFGFELRWDVCPHALPQFLSINLFFFFNPYFHFAELLYSIAVIRF